jgi:hypothetical protein
MVTAAESERVSQVWRESRRKVSDTWGISSVKERDQGPERGRV